MMSNEEWDGKVEFLLNQRAPFDIDMRRLEAAQTRTEESLDRATQNISHLAGFIHEGFGLTMNLFKETEARMNQTDAEIKELKESQKLTSEELRKFIAKVDRLTGEDQNGLQN